VVLWSGSIFKQICTSHRSSTACLQITLFSSFDESWKVGDEGEVGAYWGLWDKNEKIKFSITIA